MAGERITPLTVSFSYPQGHTESEGTVWVEQSLTYIIVKNNSIRHTRMTAGIWLILTYLHGLSIVIFYKAACWWSLLRNSIFRVADPLI